MTLKEMLAYTWLLLMGRAPSRVPDPIDPTARISGVFPRGTCPVCRRDVAITSKGPYRHRCRPVPPTTGAAGCGASTAGAGMGTDPGASAPKGDAA